MASRSTEWARRKRAELKAARGDRCEHLYVNGKRCHSRGSKANPLEFAHTAPTGLNGRGRGSTRRVQDVLRHPERYKLLCRTHHRRRDGE